VNFSYCTPVVEGTDKAMARTSPTEFFNQVKAEARKVVWATRQETVTTALFVALMLLLLSVFFLGIDSLFGFIVSQLLKLA
jgi:preprotein translocase subunit SecE